MLNLQILAGLNTVIYKILSSFVCFWEGERRGDNETKLCASLEENIVNAPLQPANLL